MLPPSLPPSRSFGVLAYELWSRQLLLYTYMRTAKGVVAGIRKPNDFAAKVGRGSRCIPYM